MLWCQLPAAPGWGQHAAFCSLACRNAPLTPEPKPPRQSLPCPQDKQPHGRLLWMLLLLAFLLFPRTGSLFFFRIRHRGPVEETCVNSTASPRMLRAQLPLKGLGWTSCDDLVVQRMHSLLLTPVSQLCRGIKKNSTDGLIDWQNPFKHSSLGSFLCFSSAFSS